MLLLALTPLLALLNQEILVSSYATDSIVRLDAASFANLGSLTGVDGAQSARFGPDGDLYVACEQSAQVLRLDGVTLAPLGVFVGDDPLTPADETGGLVAPTGAVFGPDGNLYVADFVGDDVLRYDGTTGAFIDTFVPAGTGGVAAIDGPDAGLVFGPDGDLYVPGFESDSVVRFDGVTGAFEAVVMRASQGLLNPRSLVFRDDGVLYVSSWGNNRILRATWGEAPTVFVASTLRPSGICFEPSTGHLLVVNDQNGALRRYDGTTGALISSPILPAGSPWPGATFLAVAPEPDLLFARFLPGLAGTTSVARVTNAAPFAPLAIGVSLTRGSLPIADCPGQFVGLGDLAVLQLLASDAAGRAEWTVNIPASFAGTTIWLQAIDGATCRTSLALVQSL
jgi:hypothetical protein